MAQARRLSAVQDDDPARRARVQTHSPPHLPRRTCLRGAYDV